MGEIEISGHMQFGEENALNANVTTQVKQSSPLIIKK
jgi:hypothetical protein